MKRNIVLGCILAAMVCANLVSATMDDRDYQITVIATATNSVSYVLRGELEGVYVEVPTGKTGTVTVASEQATLFSKADIAATTYFPVRIPLVSTAGVALTAVDAGSNTNAIVGKAAMAGPIAATVVGAGTGTNTWNIKLIYKR
jgi:hypothetical protein